MGHNVCSLGRRRTCWLGEAFKVNPGFGGQSFIPGTLRKLAGVRELIAATGSKATVQIDGGVNLDTGAQLAAAGADILVAGSFVFSAPDPAATIAALRRL